MSSNRPSDPPESEGHEKYAVVTEEQKTAAAKAAGLCPQCGRALIFNDDKNVPWCVHCGTHPFESPTR